MLQLEDKITALAGVGVERARLLANLGIETVDDLIRWVPRRYLDCTRPTLIRDLQFGQLAVILATVKTVAKRRARTRKLIVSALLEDASGPIEAIWFNQPYMETVLQRTKTALFVGTVRYHYARRTLMLSTPRIEERPTVIPLYSLTAGLTSRGLNRLAGEALAQLELTDQLPAATRKEADVIEQKPAWERIHFPQTMLDVHTAKRRLIFDQLLALQRTLAEVRAERQKRPAWPINLSVDLLKEFTASLPFKLTDDQRQAIWQMGQEMSPAKQSGVGGAGMHRLLNGDVGSGKTVVAAALMLLVVKSGYRAVLMAPTEILAQQHAASLRAMLSPFGVIVGLVTATIKETEADVLVGTHALIEPGLKLTKVAMAVIDEQHRFGVRQREALPEKTVWRGHSPHFLSLTATPIPRSLALVLFGDLDVTVITEMPAGRRPIVTKVVNSAEEKTVFTVLRAAFGRGEQAYVVCPLIEEQLADGLLEDERRSVTKVFKHLKEVFPEQKVAVLHGRQTSEQKERILQRFSAGKIDLLVATAVVEVGVDIPNATVMVVESAERFGVAQLHQLRGRVGRSDKPSTCFLMIREPNPLALARCQKVASSNDGFELARFDLAQRGPGELVGLAQKGLNRLFLEDLDITLLQKAQEIARHEV